MGVFRSLGRKLAYAAVLVAASIASMMLSYTLVRYSAGDTGKLVEPDANVVDEFRILLQFSDELVELTVEYLDALPTAAPAKEKGFETWVAQNFSPRLNDLRRRLTGSDLSDASFGSLLAAADQVASVAGEGGRRELGRSAAESVLEAVAEVEARAKVLGVSRGGGHSPSASRLRSRL